MSVLTDPLVVDHNRASGGDRPPDLPHGSNTTMSLGTYAQRWQHAFVTGDEAGQKAILTDHVSESAASATLVWVRFTDNSVALMQKDGGAICSYVAIPYPED